MPQSDDQKPDVEALIADLKSRVEERRRSGEYPPGMERDLDRQFEQAVAASIRTRADLDALLAAVRGAGDIGPHRISTASDVRAAAVLHGAAAKVVRRQTEGILIQVRDLAAAVEALLGAIVTQELPDLTARVDAIMDRLAAYERLPGDAGSAERALAARLDRLEAKVAQSLAAPARDPA